MIRVAQIISLLALLLTILPSVLYFTGSIEHPIVVLTALIGTIVWFISTPMWMSRKIGIDAKEVEI